MTTIGTMKLSEAVEVNLHSNEYIARSKQNIKIARVAFNLKSPDDLVKLLNQAGINVSQSSISRYESAGGGPPSTEYLIGLHIVTGVSLDVLAGAAEWGDTKFAEVDPQTQQIARMVANMGPRARDYIELTVASLYEYDREESLSSLGVN